MNTQAIFLITRKSGRTFAAVVHMEEHSKGARRSQEQIIEAVEALHDEIKDNEQFSSVAFVGLVETNLSYTEFEMHVAFGDHNNL